MDLLEVIIKPYYKLEPKVKLTPEYHTQSLKTHFPKGHEYTEDNIYRGTRGERLCRRCRFIQGKIRNSMSLEGII